MTDRSQNPMQLVLTNDPALGRIKVDMEAFFDFSFWMAEELEDLVKCHTRHRAAARPALRSSQHPQQANRQQ